ncbi:hypothetical protein T261_5323 [Streptomyces lydicus]|nr:hypothetical protein T261_5323 [Streptomyces lydicus]
MWRVIHGSPSSVRGCPYPCSGTTAPHTAPHTAPTPPRMPRGRREDVAAPRRTGPGRSSGR